MQQIGEGFRLWAPRSTDDWDVDVYDVVIVEASSQRNEGLDLPYARTLFLNNVLVSNLGCIATLDLCPHVIIVLDSRL